MLQGRFPAAISGLEGGKKEMTENHFRMHSFSLLQLRLGGIFFGVGVSD